MNLVILKNNKTEMHTQFKQMLEKKHLESSNIFHYYLTYRDDITVYNVDAITKNGSKVVAEMSENVFKTLFDLYEIKEDKVLLDILDEIIINRV